MDTTGFDDYWDAFEALADAMTEPSAVVVEQWERHQNHQYFYRNGEGVWVDRRSNWRRFDSIRELAESDPDVYTVELELPVTYGDYCGSDLDAANQRYVADNYPFVSSDGDDHNGNRMYLDITTDATPEDIRGLAEDIGRLVDYPLLDEEVHSEYIRELADESWDAYRWADLVPTIVERFRREYHRAVPVEDYDAFEDMMEDMTDNEASAIRWAYESEAEYYGESATDVRNDRNDESEEAAYREACKLWGARGK